MLYSKFIYIIGKENSNKIFFFLFLNIIYFFLESLSLISIPILVSFIVNPDLILAKIDLYFSRNIFNFKNSKFIMLLLCFLVIGLNIIKNSFLLYLTYLQNNFLRKIKINLSEKLFTYNVKATYLYHLSNNPSKLSRNISDEVQNLYIYFFHLSSLFREFSAVIIIFIILSFINFFMTLLVLCILMIISLIYIRIIKPSVKIKYIKNQNLRQSITQLIYETFGSIKDIKILNKENEIINFFMNIIKNYENNFFYISFLDKLPRVFLEIFSVLIITLFCIFYLNSGLDFKVIIPILSLLAISIMRFIPAFTSITTSIYYIKLCDSSTDLIFDSLKELEKNKIESFGSNKNKANAELYTDNIFLKLKDVTFNYPDSKIIPINNISMSIKEGKIIGITGESGSGKSTLFHIMLGFLEPKSGHVLHKGHDIFSNIENWRKEIGYISQNIYLLDSTIKKNITFNFSDNNEDLDSKRLEKAIIVSGLKEKISQLKDGVNSKVGTEGLKFSGGEKQRIAIARAIYRNPNILFMDESTSALDDGTEELVMNNLLNYFSGKTMVIIAHRKSTINRCNEVWTLDNGNLLAYK